MSTFLQKKLTWMSFFFLLLPALANAQARPIAFGQSILDTILPPSHIETFAPPFLASGDIVLIRASPESGLLRPRIRLINQAGNTVETAQTTSYFLGVQLVWQVPAGAGGFYTIVVSDFNSTNTGTFCLSLSRFNTPPEAMLMASNSSQDDSISCESTVKTFKYYALANTLAEVVVTPTSGLLRPRAWICHPNGDTIATQSTMSYFTAISVIVPPQPQNQCFYVLVADLDGTNTGNFSISQAILAGSAPSAAIQSDPSNGIACAGSDFTLAASTNVDNPVYEWSGPNGFSSGQPGITVANATTGQAGTYSLTVTDGEGCILLTASKLITVIDFDATALSDPEDGTLCEGEPFTLSADTDADTPAFSWVDHKGDTVSTQQIFSTDSALPTQSGTYTLTVTDRYGCTESADANITVHPLPSAAIDATPAGATICEGELFTLCALASVSNLDYSWSGPGGLSSDQRCISSNGATPAQGGDYMLTVTDSNGCSNSESKTVTVHPLPTAAFTPAGAEVCEGEAFTLCYSSDTSGLNFVWSGPSGFSSVEPCISFDSADTARSGAYMLTVADANGCSQAASGDVIVHALPTAAIVATPADGRVCEGAAFSLRAETDAGGPAYFWANPNGDLFSTQREVYFDDTGVEQAGIYTLTVTDGYGCSQTAAQNIDVISFSLEAQSSPSDGEVCEGAGFSVQAITDAIEPTYSWQGPGNFASELDSVGFHDATATLSGLYFVTVTDVNGCSRTDNSSIDVHSLPLAAILPTPSGATVCGGETVILCASTDAPNYTASWSGPNGFSSTLQCPAISNVTAAMSGEYTVTVTDQYGCMQSDSQDVTVNALPLTTAIVPTPANGRPCEGMPFSLNAAPVVDSLDYCWIDPVGNLISNEPSIAFANAAAGHTGLYTLIAKNSQGCQISTGTRIDVISFSLETQSNPPDGEACEGANLVIKAITDAESATYSWQGPGGSASELDSISFTNALPGQSGIYYVTVTDVNGCSQTASDTITIHRLPSADIIPFPADATVCAGDTLILCALTDAPAADFDWKGPHDLSSAEQCLNFNSATPQQTGDYILTVTDTNGCSQSANGSATVHLLPMAVIDDAPANGTVCEGERMALCARLEAQIIAYSWNGPDGFSSSGRCVDFTSSTQSQSGTYTLTVTDENGCENSTDTSIQVAELPVLTVETAGTQVNAGATGGTEPYTFIIFGGNLEDTVILSEIGELTDGEYTIILTDANGCTDAVSFVITDIVDPVAEWALTLSPNPSAGRFEVAVGNDQSLPLSISIFDPTGRLIRNEVLRTRRSTLDLSASPAGLYLLRLSSGEKTGLAKVVVAR